MNFLVVDILVPGIRRVIATKKTG